VVLDFVGSDSTLACAAAVTRQLGDLTIVGIAGGSLPVSFFGLAHEASVQTTYWGNRSELVELLDLAARGLLSPEITTFALGEALQVYAGLAAGDITGRAVVVPSSDYTP
jgi:propanol-preferring alcohol dehydrogenase